MRQLTTLALLLLAGPTLGQNDLALYAPMDGSCEPVLGDPRLMLAPAAQLMSAPGIHGDAVDVSGDCRYELGGAFPVESGTFAVWIRPFRRGDDELGRTLLSVYGPGTRAESWRASRWSVTTGGGALTLSVFPADGSPAETVSAPIDAWQPEEWHHVAAVWEGLNTGDASLRLHVDGQQASESAGLDLTVDPPGPTLHLGRDSDASPEYAEALMDDLFLYSRALTPEEIAEGVAAVRAGRLPVPESATPAPRDVPDWLSTDHAFRATLRTPLSDTDRTDAWFATPIDFTADLRDLGIPASAAEGGYRLFELAADGATETSFSLADGRIMWPAEGVTPAGAIRTFQVYLNARRYAYIGPLQVARVHEAPPGGGEDAVPPPDYATAAYGDAWDFDEGDTEAIDRFGDRDEFWSDIRVEDGVLHATVRDDPYIIWGSMWGAEDAGERQVRADISLYSQLAMRVRQSVPSAGWVLYGRPVGSVDLMRHEFTVHGQGWQTIRIDLVEDAGWGGMISAFRIDPTEDIEADIAIDWVRLLSVGEATREPVAARGAPSAAPAGVGIALADASPVAGSAQVLTVAITDADGEPVSGQPVRISLSRGSGGSLSPGDSPALALRDGLRGITGADGRLTVTYTASARAGDASDSIAAAAEFPSVRSEPVTVTVRAGAPDHYLVHADHVTIVPEAETPLVLDVRLVDAHGNPVPGEADLTWDVADATLDNASTASDPAGAAQATLVPDMATRWVYTVRVSDDRGRSGESGPICVLPDGPRPNPIALTNSGYFATGDGKPYVPLGGFYANWVGLPDAGEEGRILRSFTDATEEETLHWLGFLQRQGVNTLRFMLRTHVPGDLEPMDVGGRVNRPLFARALRLMDLARRFDIRFLLVIHDDYDKPVYCNPEKLRKFALPRFAGEDLDALPAYQRRFIRDRRLVRPASAKYTDADAIRCQDDYAREIIGYLRDNPQVFAYELENEMVACPLSWAEHAVEVIRSVDPETPICASHGGGGIRTADPLWWATNPPTDFYTYHLYPIGSTDESTDYGAAVSRLARYGRMAGACFLGESSGDEFTRYPPERTAERRYIMRDIIWMSLINGNPGCMFWSARGIEVEEFRLAGSIMGRIDWTKWQRERPSVAVVVDHPTDGDRYYRTPEGAADRAMMGRYVQHYLSEGIDFDFAMSGEGYAHVSDLAEFSPADPEAREFQVSEGYQLSALTREGGGEGLIYLRNVAGVREWTLEDRGTMHLRDRVAAPLSLEIGGPGQVAMTCWDLDTRQSRRIDGREADLGTSDHDWAIHWTRER